MDILANALNVIRVHKNAGKNECKVIASNFTGEVLKILQREGYIEEFTEVKEGPTRYFIIKGIGPINYCGVIKPRFPVKYSEIGKVEDQYLPSKDFGIIIITTPKGVVTNKEIRSLKTGGRLVAYVY
ncbi:MAG: 30S ribosomal protein S8 [Candidatus Micrarchaeia archaeon]